jgi:hypothetical protein
MSAPGTIVDPSVREAEAAFHLMPGASYDA